MPDSAAEASEVETRAAEVWVWNDGLIFLDLDFQRTECRSKEIGKRGRVER